MYKVLIPSLLLLFSPCLCHSQQKNATTDEDYPAYKSDNNIANTSESLPIYKTRKKNVGKFNYFFLRGGYPITGKNFNNPINGVAQKSNLVYTDPLNSELKVGLELGFVTHVTELGTSMLKLGLNTNFNFQYFGAKQVSGTKGLYNYTASTDGAGLFNLGIGPQLTFKPNKKLRVGLYGRIGLTSIATNYNSEQTGFEDSYKVNVKMISYTLSEDIGLDITVRRFLIGFTASFAKASPRQNTLLSDEPDQNYFESSWLSGVSRSTINPEVNFNRVTVHIGFAF